MKKNIFLLLLFISSIIIGQVKGKITDKNGASLSFVSVYVDKTVAGTTSNDNGDYVLSPTKKGKNTSV